MYIYFNAFATIAHYKDIPFMKEKKKFGLVVQYSCHKGIRLNTYEFNSFK
jgi:hypothetical protein